MYLVNSYLVHDSTPSVKPVDKGIGITGVVMYAQLTTGSTTTVLSKIETESTAVKVDLALDTKNNRALRSNEDRIPLEEWFEESGMESLHGLRIKTVMAAKYQRGRQSSINI